MGRGFDLLSSQRKGKCVTPTLKTESETVRLGSVDRPSNRIAYTARRVCRPRYWRPAAKITAYRAADSLGVRDILLSLSGRGAMLDLEGYDGRPPEWLVEEVLTPTGYVGKTPKLPAE